MSTPLAQAGDAGENHRRGLILPLVAVLLAMVGGLAWLSYLPNPYEGWADTVPTARASVVTHIGSGTQGKISVWVDEELQTVIYPSQAVTVSEVSDLLVDTFPAFQPHRASATGIPLLPKAIRRWNEFDARRIVPRLVELLEPALSNDFWQSPDWLLELFNRGNYSRSSYRTFQGDPAEMLQWRLEPGDFIQFVTTLGDQGGPAFDTLRQEF